MVNVPWCRDCDRPDGLCTCTTKPTTAECIVWIDKVLKYYHCDETCFKMYNAIRARLLAEQEMIRTVEPEIAEIEATLWCEEEVTYTALKNFFFRTKKALAGLRKAGDS